MIGLDRVEWTVGREEQSKDPWPSDPCCLHCTLARDSASYEHISTIPFGWDACLLSIRLSISVSPHDDGEHRGVDQNGVEHLCLD